MKKYKWEQCQEKFTKPPSWISVKSNHVNRNVDLSQYFDNNSFNHIIIYCDTFNDF